MPRRRDLTARINIRIHEDLADSLKQLAAKDGRRLSDQVRWILRGAVERSEPGGRHCRAAAGRVKR
jgi:plasmid stability protein